MPPNPNPNPKPAPPTLNGGTVGGGGFKSSSVSYFLAPTILSGAEIDPIAPLTP